MTYTKEQIDRANQTDLVSFLQAQGEQLERAGQEYRWKRHDSLTVRENRWYRHSQSKGGGPIDFVMEFYGKSFLEAVEMLIGERGEAPPPVYLQFRLPPKSPDNQTARNYLTAAGALMKMCRAFSFPAAISTRKPPTITPYLSAEMKAAYRDMPTNGERWAASGLM